MIILRCSCQSDGGLNRTIASAGTRLSGTCHFFNARQLIINGLAAASCGAGVWPSRSQIGSIGMPNSVDLSGVRASNFSVSNMLPSRYFNKRLTMGGRMFPMTLAGLDAATKALSR
jgi:hypothetical protein